VCWSFADNSTETFWESGDEDRNRVKTLTIVCSNKANPSALYIHIDNSRDLAVSCGVLFLSFFVS
jgi:E3 ubiquitin-protein ligase MYCBP2